MSEADEIPDLTGTLTLFYKARNGEINQLNVKHTMDPSQVKLTTEDIQLLGKTISKHLREDAF